MQNFLNKQELVVPTADVATNIFAMDVVGNKADAAAAGAVTATESLMAYSKQNVTNTEAAAAAIGVIDGFHDVPAADAATNSQMRDAIGNKTDAAAGTVTTNKSLMGYLKGVLNDTEAMMTTTPLIVSTASIALPQTATLALFTVAGAVRIIEIRGFIDVQIGAVANATKLKAGGGSVDICAAVELNAAAVNSILAITGTFANSMTINAGGAWTAQAGKIGVGAGNISVNCAGSDGGSGRVTWVCIYEPILSGGSVAAA